MAIAISATVSGPKGGKEFSVSSVEGSWTEVVDTIGSASLGQVMPGASINHLCMTVASGLGIWRIINRDTLQMVRQGVCSSAGTVDFSQCQISSVTIQPAWILQAYSLAADATASETNALAFISMSKGEQAFGALNVADGSDAEITSLINGDGIGTYYGQTFKGVSIILEPNATLNDLTMVDPNGGTILTVKGTVRDAGHYYYNLEASGFSIPVLKGTILNINCESND
jgi:hypothetical protein